MRVVLVCGGRNFGHTMRKGLTEAERQAARLQRKFVFATLDQIDGEQRVDRLIHGRATGADSCGGQWASSRFKQVRSYPARWHDLTAPGAVIKTKGRHRYNAKAGEDRNTLMLDDNPEIALIIAFPGGSGTANMIAQAKARNIEVIEVDYPCQ